MQTLREKAPSSLVPAQVFNPDCESNALHNNSRKASGAATPDFRHCGRDAVLFPLLP